MSKLLNFVKYTYNIYIHIHILFNKIVLKCVSEIHAIFIISLKIKVINLSFFLVGKSVGHRS